MHLQLASSSHHTIYTGKHLVAMVGPWGGTSITLLESWPIEGGSECVYGLHQSELISTKLKHATCNFVKINAQQNEEKCNL